MNELETINLVGYLASFLTTASWWPQFIKTYKTKNVDGLSKGYFGLLSIGLLLWLIYGFLINDWPLIIANIFGGSVCLYVFYQILQQEVKCEKNNQE